VSVLNLLDSRVYTSRVKDRLYTSDPSRAPRRPSSRLAALAVAAGLLVGVQAGILSLPADAGVEREGAGESAAVATAQATERVEMVSSEPLEHLAADLAPDKKAEVKGPMPSAPRPEQAAEQPQGESESLEEPGGPREPFNVLVLGVDARPKAAREYVGTRSDTMMVVQVTPETGRVELLSIPRDLLVELRPGTQDRINTAYAYGGVELARDVVEGLTGIPIDHYAIVDFKGFEDVIDAMGGVEVDVEDEVPPKYEIQDGPQTLNGRQALFYARYRGTAGGDLDRIQHQQRLIAALRGQALQLNTLTKVPQIVGVLMQHVSTDVGPVDTISLARLLVSRGEGGGMDAVQLQGYPTTMPNGDQVLLPDYQANEALLQEFR
jgi:polyisoprenyl-teichoic acid--peptidoglycan teichoic acid transferase